MTDRASAEELREAARAMWYAHTEDQRFAGPVSADPYGDFERALLAALRDTGPRPHPCNSYCDTAQGLHYVAIDPPDTGPRPDSGIDVERLRNVETAARLLCLRLSHDPSLRLNDETRQAWGDLVDIALSTPRTETPDHD